MPEIQAPNGDVYDLPDAIVSGLLGSPESGWSKPEPKSEPKPRKSSK